MKAFWGKNQKLLLSLAMALGLVALFKIFGVQVYETNDDTILASLSYGYYGTPQGLLVYIHPLMGQALALLQRAVPGISWYFLMELGLLVVSIAVFDRLILERFRGGTGAAGPGGAEHLLRIWHAVPAAIYQNRRGCLHSGAAAAVLGGGGTQGLGKLAFGAVSGPGGVLPSV